MEIFDIDEMELDEIDDMSEAYLEALEGYCITASRSPSGTVLYRFERPARIEFEPWEMRTSVIVSQEQMELVGDLFEEFIETE